MTPRQCEVLISVIKARGWYRARGSGERVTLASLWRAGVLERRAHRVGKSKADSAHEYRLTEEARTRIAATVAAAEQKAGK